jgi:hypothetical protein
MTPIAARINPDSPKQDINNLQDGPLLLLEKDVLRSNPEDVGGLRHEREAPAYADATWKFVSELREQQHLEGDPSLVDERVAEALNRVLGELGAFDDQRQPTTWVVGGQVKRESGSPWPDLRVCATHETNPGKIRLGEDTTGAEGCCTLRYEMLPVENGVDLRMSALGKERIVEAGKMAETLVHRAGGSGRFLMGPGGWVSPGIQAAMK